MLLSSKLSLGRRTSLVVQWLRIHLPMQGRWIWLLVWEDPHAMAQLSPCTLLKSGGRPFIAGPLIWVCLMFSHD